MTLNAFLRHERTGWVREARVLDLSLAGAGLILAEPVEVGTPVALELAAPTLWDPLSIRGVVVWCQRQNGADARTRVGVAFDHSAPEPLAALFDVLTTALYELAHGAAPGGLLRPAPRGPAPRRRRARPRARR